MVRTLMDSRLSCITGLPVPRYIRLPSPWQPIRDGALFAFFFLNLILPIYPESPQGPQDKGSTHYDLRTRGHPYDDYRHAHKHEFGFGAMTYHPSQGGIRHQD